MLVVLAGSSAFGLIVKLYRPAAPKPIPVTSFPLTKGDWHAQTVPITGGVLDMLKPDAIYEALYSNPQEISIDLFFSYFSAENVTGGVHSPKNCMPGSGWAILSSEPRPIKVNGRIIPASRLHVKYGNAMKIVDYWYVTRHGETSSDYGLKWYEMLSAVSLKPTDVSFIRFVTSDDPASVAALDEFQQTFAPEVYNVLPFGR
jgi:EpsI family protein